MKTHHALFVAVVALSLGGCAGAEIPPLTVRASELGAAGSPSTKPTLKPGQALVVEFDKGDVIPLAFSIEGDWAATPSDLAAIPIVVKERFFLRIEGSSMKASRDGVHFDEKPQKPGSFRFGVSIDGPTGVRAEMRIVQPMRGPAT